jgi:hypothetical protein
MGTLNCSCGKEKISTQKRICEDCRKEKKREKNRLDARKHRERHGSKVKRGIYCSRCNGIKEHQERGYCLACDRARYLEKSKADCTTCGAIKENIRDAYCNKCKREKLRSKSIAENRRPKNAEGRKTTCSNCGREKEETYLNESYCRNCKIFKKKKLRPFRTIEQKFKDAARRITTNKIKQGILKRLPCEVCGTNEYIQAHHDDYDKPMDIRWLCRKHHREHHQMEKCSEKEH